MLIKNDVVLLVAGGTGGHVLPAVSLSHELQKKGYNICLATDERAKNLAQKQFAGTIYVISAAQINFSSLFVLFRSIISLLKGLKESFVLIRKIKPKVIVGFGGYPTLSPMLAAIILRIPTVIHEQNVIMGRANRILSLGVKVVAGGLFCPKNGFLYDKVVVTGNPIRSSIIKRSNLPYKASTKLEPFHLFIFGGSQGAAILSDVVPKSIALLTLKQRQRLIITQQVRENEQNKVQKQYDLLGLKVKIAPFFYDIDEHIVNANLLICRSGALTVSEIAVIGRPSILIPYPNSGSNDQLLNAIFLQNGGGAEVITQDCLSPEILAKSISYCIDNPDYLVNMANSALSKGRPDAVLSLVNLIEKIAGNN
ncbi:undecaprenyldiphospho-muramoylpentapeptide beta-N-acetylglucosaminyltransferase [Candidatus Liberibacter americanus]|uniref:UDP-N-acetylglucosamine--N-acetylmuramyl-(pentapeptide) pyrophosphoryl-undecaprenol N-acetylglucosamine transferase n=1 Tax=Candidatus Liberibacter americanus str. Sao Paulo TaxID=1261131 RepID=U6B7J6_9HYPH|nr:undecaprenyldiphospho-muramoylpentapeptide beta-N-acetylglucosaminyltransferase [Candidatus Liberibacter americanus]AHA27836.1 UDP-N-acetylglucosamine:LPS N-acetylglucosamine transferase [Candidatus Liberibacter americanus str. Sao Paulo]EMS36003.1 N-acetylglucosaminyl transferase [Candidatus Liberibacter americanus PW_SP]